MYLWGTLILGCGDNPAANLMTGFKNLTSAFRKCRSCMATASDIQTKVISLCRDTNRLMYVYSYMQFYYSQHTIICKA